MGGYPLSCEPDVTLDAEEYRKITPYVNVDLPVTTAQETTLICRQNASAHELFGTLPVDLSSDQLFDNRCRRDLLGSRILQRNFTEY